MDTASDRKRMLLAMRTDIMQRLQNAQADLDAVDRLLAVQEEITPPSPTASIEDIRQAAIELLAQNGEPMHRQMLLDILDGMGICVGGKVPVNNLGSLLSRFSDDFTSHGNGVWGLKAWKRSNNGTSHHLPSLINNEA